MQQRLPPELRTGDQLLKDFAQDRVQQLVVEPSLVPLMVDQLEDLPKMLSQSGIQRRTVEQIIDFLAPVFPERISVNLWAERVLRSGQDHKPRPELAAVEQTTVVYLDTAISQIMEGKFRGRKIPFQSVLPEKTCEQVEQDSVELDRTTLRIGFLDGWVFQSGLSTCPGSHARKISRWSEVSLRSEFLSGRVNRAELSKCPRSHAGKVPRSPKLFLRSEGLRREQSEVIKVTSRSCSVQWSRISMIHGMSLLHDPLRGFVKRQGKTRRRNILRFFSILDEGSTKMVFGTCLLFSWSDCYW